jgi:hypothetical protein
MLQTIDVVRILPARQPTSSSASIALQFFGVLPRLFSSLNGSIESKQSAEWWNVVNDEKREWTDGPYRYKS